MIADNAQTRKNTPARIEPIDTQALIKTRKRLSFLRCARYDITPLVPDSSMRADDIRAKPSLSTREYRGGGRGIYRGVSLSEAYRSTRGHDVPGERLTRVEVVGIDPATATGMAWMQDGQWHTMTLDGRDDDAIRAALHDARLAGVELAAIEDCYLGVNFRTAKTLAVIQGRIASLCQSSGIRVQIVPVMCWKRAMLTVAGSFPQRRTEQKRTSIWVAKALGAQPANDNEADAVCLAEFARKGLALHAV